MNFIKMQSAGNDFVLVESGAINRDWSRIAVAMCDRHFGIGGDGLLVLLPSEKSDFRMRIFDADGFEAEACGNGIRCLAKYVFDRGQVSPGTEQILVETIAGIRRIKLYLKEKELINIQANMGKPEFRAEQIPVIIKSGEGGVVDIKSMINYATTVNGLDLILNILSMGNPHAVYFVQNPVSEFPLSRVGPIIENLGIFPNRVNFEVARIISRREIEARVWERGVGETLACGSGACAVAVAARLHGYIDNKVDIKLPGGVLQIERNGTGEVLLSGPAEKVFEGEWTDEG